MDDNFLVSRIPLKVARNLFQSYKIQDSNVKKELIASSTSQFSDDEPINPERFEQVLLEAIINYHQSL